MSGLEHITPRELRTLRGNVERPRHDCAQVERDCVDLHEALAEALRRLAAANSAGTQHGVLPSPIDDLVAELGRTGSPHWRRWSWWS